MKNQLTSATLLILNLALWLPGPAKAAETALQVGLARAKVTPEEPIRMAGHAGRTQPSEGVLAD